MRGSTQFAIALLALTTTGALAQDLPIYTDGLLNGFANFSYNGGDVFAGGPPCHNTCPSIAFTDNASASNAISLAHPSGTFASANYSGLRFFVNGGGASGQQISLLLQTNSNVNSTPVLASSVPLDGYIAGGSVPQNAWAQVDVPFAALAFTNDGSFDRIDILPATGSEPVLYIDDVALIANSASAQNSIFSDSFEPEYLFVPQYTSHSVKVYQRVIHPGVNPQFTLINTAALGAGISPNAVAVAPDGNIWVVDDGAASLRRYSLANMVGNASPAADKTVGPVGNGSSIFDMAFFGTTAYVSQSDFGATNQILKFTLSNLNAGTNTSSSLTNAGVSVPVALAFDPQGLLWVASFGNNTIARMNTSSGAIDKSIATVTANVFKDLEGLAFDQYGSLWVGNNGVPSVVAYTSSQLSAAGVGTSADPAYQIDLSTANPHGGGAPTGFAGGIAFDENGSLWINYEYSLSVLEYSLASAHAPPGPGDYSTTLLPELSSATTDPGRGGIAFWPVPSTVHR